jgi:thiosulfate dehydrogenase
MNRPSIALATAAGCAAILAGVAYAPQVLRAQSASINSSAPALPVHQVPQAKDGGVVVMLCDGKTSMEVKGLKTGESMSHAQAVEVTRELMAQWQREHPNEKWEMAQTESSAPVPAPSAASGADVATMSKAHGAKAPSKGMQQGDTYASFTDRDYKVWQNETDSFVAEGKKIFHSDKELGGTIGVSCDMCHPDASNTHPETYPKYQVQLQKVALLRDMIDWCIENPVKGKALDPNDPKLRALEAYILAQRKGVALDYGKH